MDSLTNTTQISLGARKTVLGYEIKQLPLGGYLEAQTILMDFGKAVFDRCFSGMSGDDIFEKLKALNGEQLLNMIGQVAITAPLYVIQLVSRLGGIPEDALLTDENIGVYGLLQIIKAIIEVNRLGEAFEEARGLIMPPSPTDTGFKA